MQSETLCKQANVFRHQRVIHTPFGWDGAALPGPLPSGAERIDPQGHVGRGADELWTSGMDAERQRPEGGHESRGGTGVIRWNNER